MNRSENSELVTREEYIVDELSWLDLITFVRRNFGILLGSALIGSALGLVVAFIQPSEWEAKVLVRIGQLGNIGATGVAIEPPLQVIDRIKYKSFQNDVLKRLGIPIDEDDANAKLFRDTLKVKLEKSELINLSLRAKSPDESKLHMDAVVNELRNIHVRMSVPTVNRWQQELESVKYELEQVGTEAERLAKSLGGQSDSLNDRNFSQVALLSNILIAREEELRNFRDRKRMLEERLSPERTFPTDVLGRIEVSPKPVFPKKTFFALGGLIMGLLLGVMLSIFRFGSRSGAKIRS